MATWYVKGQTGDDGNDGLTTATPRKTMPANGSVANGDTVNVAEQIRDASGNAATITYTSKSNLTIQQWSGQPQAIFHGGTQIGTGWTNTAGDTWTKTLAGLTISRLAFKYDASTTATGHHYGIMRSVAVPTNAGEYKYAANLLTIVVPAGQSPNGSAADVLAAQIDGIEAAIEFAGGDNNRVVGVHFKLYPSAVVQKGNGVCFKPTTHGLVDSCKFWDMGYHCILTLGGGNCSGTMFSGCTLYNCVYNGAYATFYQENASGSLTGCIAQNCIVHMRRYLGVDGTNTTESLAVTQGQSAMAQDGFLTHADTGTPIADVLLDGCTFIEYEPGSLWANAANQTATSSTWAWSSCPVRIDRCVVRGGGSQVGATNAIHGTCQSLAVRRTTFDFRNAGPSGLCNLGGLGCYSINGTGAFVLFDSCSFVTDFSNAAAQIYGFYPAGATDQYRFLNCSFHDTGLTGGANRRNVFVCPYGSQKFLLRGCAFSFGVDSALNFLFGESNVATVGAGNMIDVMDCAYYMRSAKFSNVAAYDTQAEWLAGVDTAGKFTSTTMFPNAPTSLILTPASSAWTLRRTTTAVVPSAGGVNGMYAGFFGSYQYGATYSRRSRQRGR